MSKYPSWEIDLAPVTSGPWLADRLRHEEPQQESDHSVLRIRMSASSFQSLQMPWMWHGIRSEAIQASGMGKGLSRGKH